MCMLAYLPLDHALTRQHRCPTPSPCTLLLYGTTVARNAGCAMLWGAPACTSLETSDSGTYFLQARTSEHTRPCPPMPTLSPKYQQTSEAPKSTRGAREEAQRGTCRSGALCPSAPYGCDAFDKPRPSAGCAGTALPRHHCLVTHRRALTWIWLLQKRPDCRFWYRQIYVKACY